MKVTVDANILFSALIKDGQTRNIWFNPETELYAPKFLLIEFEKYKAYLKKKFTGKQEEFDIFCDKLTSQIKLVNDEDLKPYLYAACFLSKDEKDWLYLACALKEDTIIWSNDKEFKQQKRVKIKTTKELILETGKL